MPRRALVVCFVVGAALGAALWTFGAAAQTAIKEGGLYAPSIFDLQIGAHARELPGEEYIDYACGTGGGPPSLPLSSWRDFRRCAAEASTRLREVYFRHDDEPEYTAKARSIDNLMHLYEYTSVYAIPIIASALFDDNGILRGIRMVTDPRVPLVVREKGASLSGFLQSRYGDTGWSCADLPVADGETAYRGALIKHRCERFDPDGMALLLETYNYRRAGQNAVDPFTRVPTEGQFVSATRFQAILTAAPAGTAERLAAAQASASPTTRELAADRARDCAGCDLRGVDLKRMDLTGANLRGANLAGANLHGAVLAGADLEGANLTDANLNRADIKRANLRGATLINVMLYEARLDAADLAGADLTQALAGKVQLIRANLSGARMLSMDLRHARLSDANLSNADLTYSWIDDAQLTRADLTGAKLVETVLVRAGMVSVRAAGADFEAADLYGANLRAATLDGVNFAYARLTSANLSEASVNGAIWTEADLPAGFEPAK
jgi:uncharacterized protein YjbI with pentapeptide repeats